MGLDKIRRRSYASQGLPAGTTFDFDYTGTVQEIELPKGRYKLQCWGAQGGDSYEGDWTTGSNGGYSEGILNLTSPTTLYAFVGGKGSTGSTTSMVNGGWNGGGASVGKSFYSVTDRSGSLVNVGDQKITTITTGTSYPASGGGATDFATVTSDMSLSNWMTNRSSSSLLSRCIVAGGGAGGSYINNTVTTTIETVLSVNGMNLVSEKEILNISQTIFTTIEDIYTYYYEYDYAIYDIKLTTESSHNKVYFDPGIPYYDEDLGEESYLTEIEFDSDEEFTISFPGWKCVSPQMIVTSSKVLSIVVTERYYSNTEYRTRVETEGPIETFKESNQSQEGGGTSGKGYYPGTQSSAGTGGGFGYGSPQNSSNYMYSSGAGGGGWYGGSSHITDEDISTINKCGGGSGFVNTAANAQYRPSGYTGLELESGTTIDGSQRFPTIANDGTTEVGHAGNGYARITAL